MTIIYQMAKKLHDRIGLKETSVFLFLNTVFWAFLSFLVGMIICRMIFGAWEISGIVLFCIVGYAAVILGFFGGAIYLYQKN